MSTGTLRLKKLQHTNGTDVATFDSSGAMDLSKIRGSTGNTLTIDTSGSERMRVDASGNLFVGKTSSAFSSTGTELGANGQVTFTSDGNTTVQINRKSSNGEILRLSKDGTPMLELGNDGNDGMIQSDGDRVGFTFGSVNMVPRKNGAISDNTVDLGHPSYRFDDLYATNGTIQTSDQNEKQDIASATAKELNVAKKLSTLFKTFRWKDKVAEKGDKARTHTGIIAQEIQSAFSAEGLDASNYGLFTSNTWTDDDGKEQTRLGVRYPELFSFIFSSIETRLTALESK